MSLGYFTRSYRVPHPRLDPRWIATVHLALVCAFEMIRSDGFDLASAREDDISFKLEEVLMNRLLCGSESELDLSFIVNVTRESATANHDQSSLGRKPDFVFHLNRRELCHTHNRVQDCLFAECKPVGRAHPLRDHYCAVEKTNSGKEHKTSGMERFIRGGYASAMEQGIMIAYVRDGFQITRHLADALLVPKLRNGLGQPSALACIVETNRIFSQGLYITTHQRLFSWPDGNPATPIDLYHSWHEC